MSRLYSSPRAATRLELGLLIDGEPAFRRICEAIEAARHSVWVTVTFMWCLMAGAHHWMCSSVQRRGVDVRVIFWRPDAETKSLERNAFWGSPAQLDSLRRSYPKLSVRWDHAHPNLMRQQRSLTPSTLLGQLSVVTSISPSRVLRASVTTVSASPCICISK